MGTRRQEVYVFLGHSVRKIYNLHCPNDHIQKKGIMNIYNLILYIGLGLMLLGFFGFIVSIIMERHYERKLFELNQKLRKDDKWRSGN